MKPLPPEPVGQLLLVKSLTNICFGFFVVSVLIFTVIATFYYQPTNPWFEPAKPISKEFDSIKEPTFKPDDTVLRTGEDFQGPPVAISAEPPAISEALVEALENAPSANNQTSGCSPQQRAINCSDPRVLAAIVKFNLKRLPNLEFYEYLTPVRGKEEDECDVSWRYRHVKEKSWRKYRDYRRFALTLEEDCSYKIREVGGFHSGKNAKPFRVRKGPFGRNRAPRATTIDTQVKYNLTLTDDLEIIDDALPTSVSEGAFRNNRYLYYSIGGDRCKGMNHFLWSFLCALGEAQFLNRTFVVDLNFCLSGSNNLGHADEDDKDFRLYFDFVHLKEAASIIDQKQFLAEWEQANRHRTAVSVTEVRDFKAAPMQLRNVSSTIIWRKFDAPEPDNYWYRVCEGETENVIQRPWNLLWKSKRLMDIVNSICGKLEWNFDVVHVVRGYKASNKELWPNLDSDTSPEALLEKLKDKIEEQRYVYIATNEQQQGYFDRLKEKYHVYTLDDFNDLWTENSLWYNETKDLMGHPVDFDGYMRVEVDTEVSYRARKRIETFNKLTMDCKDGVNTC